METTTKKRKITMSMLDQIEENKTVFVDVVPDDKRCRFWCKKIKTDDLPIPSAVGGANDINTNYIKKGNSIAIEKDEIVIFGEEVHHIKNRGWNYRAFINKNNKLFEIPDYDNKSVKTLFNKMKLNKYVGGAGKLSAAIRSYYCFSLLTELKLNTNKGSLTDLLEKFENDKVITVTMIKTLILS